MASSDRLWSDDRDWAGRARATVRRQALRPCSGFALMRPTPAARGGHVSPSGLPVWVPFRTKEASHSARGRRSWQPSRWSVTCLTPSSPTTRPGRARGVRPAGSRRRQRRRAQLRTTTLGCRPRAQPLKVRRVVRGRRRHLLLQRLAPDHALAVTPARLRTAGSATVRPRQRVDVALGVPRPSWTAADLAPVLTSLQEEIARLRSENAELRCQLGARAATNEPGDA